MKRIIMVLAMLMGTSIVLAGPASATGDHEWKYNVTCEAVSGSRPNTDSVDSNIRIKNLDTGETKTFNYHGPDNGPSGSFSYSLKNNYKVPSDWTHYEIQWVQVNGTNYHFEGSVKCGKETEPPIDDKYPYEVTVCWVMDSSDGVEGTYEWPQTKGSCTPVPKCDEVIEIQSDKYWIRDKTDEDYLAGLTKLNSSSDDASLEPHGYFSKVFRGGECTPPPPVDVCPDIEGNQPTGTDCTPVVVPPVDVCPDIPGDQPTGTNCNPVVVPPVDNPPVTEPPVVVPPVTTPPVITPPAVPPVVDTPKEKKVVTPKPIEYTPVVSYKEAEAAQVLPNTGGFSERLLWLGLGSMAVGCLMAIGAVSTRFRRHLNQ